MLELPQSQIEIYDGLEVAQVISELAIAAGAGRHSRISRAWPRTTNGRERRCQVTMESIYITGKIPVHTFPKLGYI